MKTMSLIAATMLCGFAPIASGQEWIRQITGANVNIKSVAVDSQGNTFVSGTSIVISNEVVNFGPTNLNVGPFFARYSPKGQLVYAQQTEQVRSIATVGAKIFGIDGSALFEIRDNGNVIPKLTIEGPEYSITHISPCNDSSFVIAGTFRNHLTLGKRTLTAELADVRRVFLARLHSNGKVIWLVEVPVEFVTDVTGTRSGGAYILTQASVIENEALVRNTFNLQAFDQNGFTRWTNQVPGDYTGTAYAIAADPAGNSYVTGSFFGEIATPEGGEIRGNHQSFVYSFTQGGYSRLAWTFRAGSWDFQFGMDVITDRAGNWFASTTYIPELGGGFDGLITQNGDVFNALQISGAGDETVHVLAMGRKNELLVAGDNQSFAQIGQTTITNSGTFIAKFKLR